MKKITSNSPNETIDFGYKLGKLLTQGCVVCLMGDLGAGKTTLTQSIAKGLGVKDYVTSPTFTILNEYMGRYPLYHFDVYRISDIDEMYDIGYEDYIYSDGVSIIEWANLIEDILPKERIEIYISKDKDDKRIMNIEAYGEQNKKIIEELHV
ncbi:tRNA (adenosine(37)-N6)-threonylcarbamoyltransferase complex ATPase subunit type 1 TsaE [Abyssisolibacter fermentans]|uniref:tRNA (adenosine(37)-N6)-threonylcarbamoyltransferase complex ATPase subunit type 1 TsaE n=1 Tax=Abyssisolibacter fermentans TaxID=1766203 RepID=UPI00082EAB92|nr:tRNA (adenosine(37)-N6)-threonylcarbamoyltransferase complex ATPase subunit type 1 TsaE [Abyssisolibacter fermentans]